MLILESLGSTELLFILAMALVFFGPRKLPQLSRSFGKGMAEFRRASEDFKRTWEREVTLEEAKSESTVAAPPDDNSSDTERTSQTLQLPTIEAVPSDRVVPRQPKEASILASEPPFDSNVEQPGPSRKSEWI